MSIALHFMHNNSGRWKNSFYFLSLHPRFAQTYIVLITYIFFLIFTFATIQQQQKMKKEREFFFEIWSGMDDDVDDEKWSMGWGENRKIRNICETWKVPPSRCTHKFLPHSLFPLPPSHTTLTAVMNKHIHMRSICYQLKLQQTENFSLRFHLSLSLSLTLACFLLSLFLRSFQNHTSFLFAQSFSFPFQPKKKRKVK